MNWFGKLSMKRLWKWVPLATVMVSPLTPLAAFSKVHAATHISYRQKEITLNGHVVSRPDGFVLNQTTYVPIWYVMQALKQLHMTSSWNGHVWQLSVSRLSSNAIKPFTPLMSGAAIVVNGMTMAKVPVVTAVDPSSGKNTTFMPIWYVMQMLHNLGIENTWNGSVWDISAQSLATGNQSGQVATSVHTTASTSQSVSLMGPSFTSFQPAVGNLTQSGKSDATFFKRASESMYISAQTANPLSGSSVSGSSLNDVQPGQTIYLYTWEDGNTSSLQKSRWYVNSDSAMISQDTRHVWSLVAANGSKTAAAEASFTAFKPGVYTIQAEAPDGTFSVPLTVAVGIKDFSQSLKPLQSYTGVAPFTVVPGQKPTYHLPSQDGTSFDIYPATANGWIPIAGQTTQGAKEVEVTFGTNPAGPAWSYAIPVNASGSFASMVRSPLSGNAVEMTLFTNYVQDMTSWGNGGKSTDYPETIHIAVNAPAPSTSELDMLASAKMNFNLNPLIRETAATLYQAAGSPESGIEAINNYVASYISYDASELQPNQYRFQNTTETWKAKLGVCEDFAELEASMLRAIGIPTKTIQGYAHAATQTTEPVGKNGDNHEWVEAYDGSNWILADPTWSGADGASNGWETNRFFTNTTEFRSTHAADSSLIGTSE